MNAQIEIGQKFTLHRIFGNLEENCFVTQISPSGKFFKVDKSKKLFSIKTLHSKGSTITSGYYLIKK